MNRANESSSIAPNDTRRWKWRDGVLMVVLWMGAVLIIGMGGVQSKNGNGTLLKSLRQVQPFKMVADWIDPPQFTQCTSCGGCPGLCR